MKYRASSLLGTALFLACAIGVNRAEAGVAYRAIDLTPPGSDFAIATGVLNGQVIGYASGPGFSDDAMLWTGANANAVNLNPPGSVQSMGFAITDGAQVGYALSGDYLKPVVWHGSAGSVVNLALPAGVDVAVALAISGTQIVGSGNPASDPNAYKALLWNNIGGTYVPTLLNPTGYGAASVTGVDSGRQVGSASNGTGSHAALWSGSAGSFVDLSPAGASDSGAAGISGEQIVGSADVVAGEHAILWNGLTADSAVDLNRPGLSFSRGEAIANGVEVGLAAGTLTNDQGHAFAWFSSPESGVDLQQFLPSGQYTHSIAQGVDSQGDVVGYAEDVNGHDHAIEWVPTSVPLPVAVWPAGGLMILIAFAASQATARNRKRDRPALP
jgi:hypothetical protein